MTKDEQDKVRAFMNAVDRILTSASNPGRAAAVVNDNTPGSPYHDLVMAKIEVDAMLWETPFRIVVDPKMRPDEMWLVAGPKPEQCVRVTGLAPQEEVAHD